MDLKPHLLSPFNFKITKVQSAENPDCFRFVKRQRRIFSRLDFSYFEIEWRKQVGFKIHKQCYEYSWFW